MLATALDLAPEALIVCNGFKDKEYLSSAALATRLGKRVVVVIEKLFELEQVLELARQGEPTPLIGFRLKLQARGSGLWEKSGGFASKFGLTTRQLLLALERLSHGRPRGTVQLLHFHIGSQITEIRRLKTAIKEAGPRLRQGPSRARRGDRDTWTSAAASAWTTTVSASTSSDASR